MRQVADWIIRYRENLGAPVTNMELQKQLYYAQAFHLAQTGKPLFAGQFQAWRWGPVLREEYDRFKSAGGDTISFKSDDAAPVLEGAIENYLISVSDFLADFPPLKLSKMTHAEKPWLEARGSAPSEANSNQAISDITIRDYYADLIEAGEDRLSALGMLDLEDSEEKLSSLILYQIGICAKNMFAHPLYNWKLARDLRLKGELKEWDERLYDFPKEASLQKSMLPSDASLDDIAKIFSAH